MKKLSFNSFLSGFLTCIMLSTSLSYAAQYRPIQVALDTVKRIIINGADKTPTTFTPFVYQGNTYVPLAYIAEALDMKVKWDSKTSTIYINDSGNEREDTYLNGYGYEELSAAGRLIVKDYNGKKVFYFEEVQPDKYRDNTAPSRVSYKINKKYKHLVGKFGFFNGGNKIDQIDAQLTIYGDDSVIYQSSFIRGNMDPINLKIDISDIKNLKLEVKATSFEKGAKANIGFVDLRLSKE